MLIPSAYCLNCADVQCCLCIDSHIDYDLYLLARGSSNIFWTRPNRYQLTSSSIRSLPGLSMIMTKNGQQLYISLYPIDTLHLRIPTADALIDLQWSSCRADRGSARSASTQRPASWNDLQPWLKLSSISKMIDHRTSQLSRSWWSHVPIIMTCGISVTGGTALAQEWFSMLRIPLTAQFPPDIDTCRFSSWHGTLGSGGYLPADLAIRFP